jgi:hypothetical protein
MASGVDSLLPHILREDETRIEPSWIAKFVAAKYAQNLVQESSHKRKLQHLV